MRVIVTDPKEVEKLAAGMKDENTQFKAFLLQADRAQKDIESFISYLSRRTTEAIDCTACGECCRRVRPLLDDFDIERLTDGLNIESEKFKGQYLTKHIARPYDYIFNTLPCPFLDGNRCSYYEFRPQACDRFPQLGGSQFFERLANMFHQYTFCPIVFNVLEDLKMELGIKGPEK